MKTYAQRMKEKAVRAKRNAQRQRAAMERQKQQTAIAEMTIQFDAMTYPTKYGIVGIVVHSSDELSLELVIYRDDTSLILYNCTPDSIYELERYDMPESPCDLMTLLHHAATY